jgi:hypothetical protein
MEKVKEVACVEISMTCNKCTHGEMIPTGYSYMTSPTQYPHECNICENREVYLKNYPCIEYRKC